jgi:hypothetical protein
MYLKRLSLLLKNSNTKLCRHERQESDDKSGSHVHKSLAACLAPISPSMATRRGQCRRRHHILGVHGVAQNALTPCAPACLIHTSFPLSSPIAQLVVI